MPDPVTTPAAVTGAGGTKPPEVVAPKVKRPAVAFAFLVEVGGPHNENLMCPIDSQVVRGKWARKNLIGKQFDGDFVAMPDLPGICFVVNTEKRVVRRFDPLADPDNAKLLKRAQRISLSLDGIKRQPDKPKTWKESTLSDDTLKTFVFWARRMVDVGLMAVIKGRVPEWPEIQKLPGVIQLNPYDTKAGVERGVPDAKIRYAKPMPPDEDDATDEMYMEEIPDAVINADGFDKRREDDEDDDE